MGTVTIPGLETVSILPPTGTELSIGGATFPQTDGVARSSATFGDTGGGFKNRSQRQFVDTATAIIAPGITIVGVSFDGPVVLTFADPGSSLTQVDVVDEGGFCNATNTITIGSSGSGAANGSLVMERSYGNMKVRSNGADIFSESSNTAIDESGNTVTTNSDGSVTTISSDGTSVTESTDGLATYTVLPDGTTIQADRPASGSPFENTITVTVFPDGTVKEDESYIFGGTSVTNYPNGDVLEEDELSFGGFTFDSSETFTEFSTGNVTEVSTNFFGVRTEEKTYVATGVVEITTYNPNNADYTVATTPPGTTQTLPNNPYYVP